jgi:hypothetical protein
MELTIDIPDDLAVRLQAWEQELPRILEAGLREVCTTEQAGFEGIAEVLEIFASLPTPEEILRLRPSKALQARIHTLLEKNRTERLTPAEEHEWAQYEVLEHVVRLAKAKASLKIKAS